MTSTSIREHLRAAIEETIAHEKQRLHEIYDKSDADIAARIEMMRPLISSLKALELEIGKVEGIEISPAPHGHMATVQLNSSTLQQSFSISTTSGNLSFEVEERSSYKFGDYDTFEKQHRFQAADQVLAIVIEAVGKYIAQQRVLQERKK